VLEAEKEPLKTTVIEQAVELAFITEKKLLGPLSDGLYGGGNGKSTRYEFGEARARILTVPLTRSPAYSLT